MSVSSASPQDLFGGTWERITDRFLLAAGSAYAAGAIGGEATVTLGVDQMPYHEHPMAYFLKTDNNAASSQTAASSGMPRCTGFGTKTLGAGGGQPHNNMPPYLAVYIWKRIA